MTPVFLLDIERRMKGDITLIEQPYVEIDIVLDRRPVVRLHSRVSSPQAGQRINLVDQTVPLASHHSLFESRQHPFRPDLGFHPRPSCADISGGLSRTCRHCFRLLPCSVRHVSTFLRPFAPGPLQALLRSYGRSDSCSPGSSAFSRHEHRLGDAQVSLIHAPGLPALPSPTTCGCFPSSGHVTPRRVEPRLLPHEAALYGDSGLRHSLAGSPHRTGRIEFLIVRTGRSPPAAPHPVSPRRSGSRLQVTLTWSGLSPLQPGALSGALAPPSWRLRCRPEAGATAGIRRAHPSQIGRIMHEKIREKPN